MARTELTEDELKIHQQAIESAIKKDFLKSNVSYQNANEMKYYVGFHRETDNAKSEVRRKLKDDLDASIVSVGDGRVAVVKRSPK